MKSKNIDDLLHEALYGKVKWKRNSTQNLRSIASKVAKKRNIEVMLKITGYSKAGGENANLKAHIDYISRNEKLEIEDDNGMVFSGKRETKEFLKEWERDILDRKPRNSKNGNDTMHLVLSMPSGIDPEAVKNATRNFLKNNFYNHEYIFVLHTDADGGNPHTHSVIKTLGFDNSKLNPRKDDLQKWRESFAAEMQNQGVENAEATPRKTRGVIKKSEKKLIRRVELSVEKEFKIKPEKFYLTKENKEAWMDVAKALKEQGTAEDNTLSSDIEKFISDVEKSTARAKNDDFER